MWVRELSFLGLVVAAGVDGEFAQELAGGGVDDADVEVVDEQDDVGSGVGSTTADVVQPTVDAQGDGAGLVDAVVTDSHLGVGVSAVAGQCLGHGLEQGCWRCSMWQGAVGTAVVVVVDERVQLILEGSDGRRLVLLGA